MKAIENDKKIDCNFNNFTEKEIDLEKIKLNYKRLNILLIIINIKLYLKKKSELFDEKINEIIENVTDFKKLNLLQIEFG